MLEAPNDSYNFQKKLLRRTSLEHEDNSLIWDALL